MRTFHQAGRRSSRLMIPVVPLALAFALVAGSAAQAFDGAIIDTKADPRVDFGRYAYGLWLDKTPLPVDRPAYGTFDEIGDPLEEKLYGIVSVPQPTASGAKLNELFRQSYDQPTRDALGLDPIRRDLNAIAKSKNLKQLFSVGDGLGPIELQVGPGPEDPSKNVLGIGAPTLALGGRNAYLANDAGSKRVHQQYILFLTKELKIAGYPTAAATREAARVFALERKIAALTQDQREVAANIKLAINPTAFRDVQELTPSVNWEKGLAGAALTPDDIVIVTEPQYLNGFDALFRKVPLTTVKAYEVTRLLNAVGPYLDDRLGKVRFDFFGKVLNGQQQRAPLLSRALGQVTDLMPDAVGQIYAQRYFPEGAKTEITAMTTEIIAAFRNRIAASAWLSPDAKQKATEKLDKVKVRVAFPERFLTYDDVTLGAGYADSVRALFEANARRAIASIGQPVDPSNWGPVAIVNAFYDPSNNSINFPAGILTGSFFDLKNDPAANFGAIGAVIGHELTHGFDISGSQFDGDGRFINWWSDVDRQAFNGLNARLVSQYSALTVPNAGNVDGQLTVGENVADLGGVQVAFDAMNARLAKVPDPGLIDGLTQQQRFFVAWAQGWKQKSRPEFDRFLLTADSHSPAAVRAVQPLRNMNAFYDAFGIKEGDPMWLTPAERLTIW
jgi:putative endopeptidase